MDTIHPNVSVTHEQIADFCGRWNIVRFELFGSVLRDDFRPDSDVDVLVTFAPDTHRKIADWTRMEDEIMTMFGRHVDLIERRLIEDERNPIRRRNILGSARSVYAAV